MFKYVFGIETKIYIQGLKQKRWYFTRFKYVKSIGEYRTYLSPRRDLMTCT